MASNSPRRKQLLSLGGWEFTILAPLVDESVRPGESPGEYVLRLAESKARAASSALDLPALHEVLIVAADTAVVDAQATAARSGDGSSQISAAQAEILGKPIDAADAGRMLRRLRGRTHQVYTAVAVLRPWSGAMSSEVVITDVPMRNYSDEEMLAYIESGDPLDKAGAYAIQHAGFRPVKNLTGCYANVMGLPVCRLARLLQEFGAPPPSDISQACQSALGYACLYADRFRAQRSCS
ncbi:MAG: Maf family protein [Anaerolineales bacterium]|nr:Maf family protein [Anaerolineales bacterium]